MLYATGDEPCIILDNEGIAKGVNFEHDDKLRRVSWASNYCTAINIDSGEIVHLRNIGGRWIHYMIGE